MIFCMFLYKINKHIPNIIPVTLVITVIFRHDDIAIFLFGSTQFSGQFFFNLILLILITLVLFKKNAKPFFPR